MKPRILLLLVLVGSSLPLAIGQSRITLEPSSIVTYQATDGIETWRGRAPLDSMVLEGDVAHLQNFKLELTLKPDRFDSGNFLRDINAQRTVFDTSVYPTISFTGREVKGERLDLPSDATRKLLLSGELNMHGVTRTIIVPVTVMRSGQHIEATGSFTVLLSDYGMKRVRLLFFQVADEVDVRFDIKGRLKASGG